MKTLKQIEWRKYTLGCLVLVALCFFSGRLNIAHAFTPEEVAAGKSLVRDFQKDHQRAHQVAKSLTGPHRVEPPQDAPSGPESPVPSESSTSVRLAALSLSVDVLDESTLLDLHEFSKEKAVAKTQRQEDRYVSLRASSKFLSEMVARELKKTHEIPPDLARPEARALQKSAPHGRRQLLSTLSNKTRKVTTGHLAALREIAADTNEPVELRSVAIKHIGFFAESDEDIQALVRYARNANGEHPSTLQKRGLFALTDSAGVEIIPTARQVLRESKDADVIGAAALALSFTQSEEALDLILEHASRFDAADDENASFESAVFRYKDLINAELSSDKPEKKRRSLRALSKIQWAQEDRYKGRLTELLRDLDTETEPGLLSELLTMLVDSRLERSHCTEILSMLADKKLVASVAESADYQYLASCANWEESKPLD